MLLYHKFSTVILFYVSVPVLSEHMQELVYKLKYQDPSVSTPSKFFTSTLL